MAASKDQIRMWLGRASLSNTSHMLVVCDTYDYDDYPVYVLQHQDVNTVIDEYNAKSMQRIMEVYSYRLDIEEQLEKHRVWNV